MLLQFAETKRARHSFKDISAIQGEPAARAQDVKMAYHCEARTVSAGKTS